MIAANSNGDSDPCATATGTPASQPGQVRQFWENEVVKIFESSFPWLRETLDYLTTQNVPVFWSGGFSGGAEVLCTHVTESKLRECDAFQVRIPRYYLNLIYGITHELAYNHNGDGDGEAAEGTATPTAMETTAPALLLARFDYAWVRLIWNEALNESSLPASTAFTVNVNGASGEVGEVAVLGNVVTLGVSGITTATSSMGTREPWRCWESTTRRTRPSRT